MRSKAQQPVIKGGFIKAHPPRHLLAAVVAAGTERNLAALEISTKRKLQLLYPDDDGASEWDRLTKAGLAIPDRWSLSRGYIAFDITCMCWDRDTNSSRRAAPLTRHLCFDSSPQGGQEIMGVHEMTLVAVSGKEQVLHRTLPCKA